MTPMAAASALAVLGGHGCTEDLLRLAKNTNFRPAHGQVSRKNGRAQSMMTVFTRFQHTHLFFFFFYEKTSLKFFRGVQSDTKLKLHLRHWQQPNVRASTLVIVITKW